MGIRRPLSRLDLADLERRCGSWHALIFHCIAQSAREEYITWRFVLLTRSSTTRGVSA